jgi:hypothetical protein
MGSDRRDRADRALAAALAAADRAGWGSPVADRGVGPGGRALGGPLALWWGDRATGAALGWRWAPGSGGRWGAAGGGDEGGDPPPLVWGGPGADRPPAPAGADRWARFVRAGRFWRS